MRAHEVEQLLTGQPVPAPPKGLAERIKAEIPETLQADPGLGQHPIAGRSTGADIWYLWKVAAVLLPLLIGAAATWYLLHPQVQTGRAARDTEQQEVRSAAVATPVTATIPAEVTPLEEASVDASAGASTPAEAVTPAEHEVTERTPTVERRVATALTTEQQPPAPGPEPSSPDLSPSQPTEVRALSGAATGGPGQIVSQVTYEGGALPGVMVSILSPALTGGSKTAVTDSSGMATFRFLPAGDYEVQWSLESFQTITKPIKVAAGAVRTVEAVMYPKEVTEEVTVTAAYETIPAASQPRVTFDRELLEQLPVKRIVESSTLLTPGVAANSGSANVAPAPGEQRFMVNGVVLNDNTWGSAYKLYIEEAAAGAGTESSVAAPSTGGTDEPNDMPYGDMFFKEYGVNPFIDTEDDHLSTFGLEVDTGSYTMVRSYLEDGNLPPREAVRIEELLNYFDYGDEPPAEGGFALYAEGAPSPFGEGERYYLLRFGIKGRVVDRDTRPPAQLVFVVDVSGSMDREDRLGLVKRSLHELLGQLREDDRVGLVIYGSTGRVLLRPTADHEAIRTAIGQLQPGGSTNAEEGLVLAYELAAEHLIPSAINRIILCSDGVANVGRTGPDSILERIRGWAEQGIELTTVGFGMGNYNDVLMEQLADNGNGRYTYVDDFDEARRLFVEELTGTLMTIGYDSKAQVEFNPKVVSRYRLLGYENRDIADERFRDPTVDAGEIGAGHTVTAVYEIKLQRRAPRRQPLATLRLRYRPAGKDQQPVELEHTIRRRDLCRRWDHAPEALQLATLVAEYAEILKGSFWARGGELEQVLQRARALPPQLREEPRVAELLRLIGTAAGLRESHREHHD